MNDELYFHGSSSGNPGPSAAGYFINSDYLFRPDAAYIGESTAPFAQHIALVLGLLDYIQFFRYKKDKLHIFIENGNKSRLLKTKKYDLALACDASERVRYNLYNMEFFLLSQIQYEVEIATEEDMQGVKQLSRNAIVSREKMDSWFEESFKEYGVQYMDFERIRND